MHAEWLQKDETLAAKGCPHSWNLPQESEISLKRQAPYLNRNLSPKPLNKNRQVQSSETPDSSQQGYVLYLLLGPRNVDEWSCALSCNLPP